MLSQNTLRRLGFILVVPLLLITFSSSTRLILQRWKLIPHLHDMVHNKSGLYNDFKMHKYVVLMDEDGLVADDHYDRHPFVSYGHIYAAWLWSFLGFFQLSNYIPIASHRLFGTIFFCLSFWLTITSLMMIPAKVPFSFPFSSPWSLYYPLLVLSVWFSYTVVRAWTAVMSKRILAHRIWTVRHVAAGMGVSMMRFVLYIVASTCTNVLNKTSMIQSIVTTEIVNFCAQETNVDMKRKLFAVSAWMGFFSVPIFAEIGIRLWMANAKTVKKTA